MLIRTATLLTIALIAALALSCGDDDGDSSASPGASTGSGEVWEQVLPPEAGAFAPEPEAFNQPVWKPDEGMFPQGLQPLVAFNDELWMVSQTVVFSSADGLEWQMQRKTDTGGRLQGTFAYFNDKLFLYGGLKLTPGVNYANASPEDFQNEIWSSPNGVTWSSEGVAAWRARKAATVISYNDKLWLFGGAAGVTETGDGADLLNDVWSSEDGVEWTQVTATAAWAPRQYPKVLVFDDAMYLIGSDGQADIWRSTDGAEWEQVSEEAAFLGRFGYGAGVLGGKLWVYGGCVGEDCRDARNDVWSSADGVTWTQETENAPWDERSTANSVVFQDKIWIYSGKHTGNDPGWLGDAWVLRMDT